MTSPNPNYAANYAVLAEYMSDIAIRTARQSAQVITDAAAKVDAGTHRLDDCYQALTTLAGISLMGWTEAATSIMAGTGFADLSSADASQWYPVPGDTTKGHRVKLVGPLSRSVADDVIVPALIGFEGRSADGATAHRPGGILPAGTTEFRLLLNRSGRHSGCYVGKAQVTQLADATGSSAAVADALDVEIEL